MDTRLAGIICHVVSIFATNALITTTEGNGGEDIFISQELARCLGFAFLSNGSHKDGYEIFASWKKVWTTNGKSEPSLKAFMADQQLPFWVS